MNKFKNDIMNSVSHELRTPLNCVINYINTALGDTNIPEKV